MHSDFPINHKFNQIATQLNARRNWLTDKIKNTFSGRNSQCVFVNLSLNWIDNEAYKVFPNLKVVHF